ncbi:MAG: polymorphic toxin-type HINT domain-containing protein [Eggerthellaceae bacterium]|nr:polymorphic toxin-type HINT domain-containing protein [Eggerthellaceae bacterium]
MGEKALNAAQLGLDIVGMIPGVGTVANGVNAAIYLARGDYLNAGLSAASMIPFAGTAIKGAALVAKGATLIGKGLPVLAKGASALGTAVVAGKKVTTTAKTATAAGSATTKTSTATSRVATNSEKVTQAANRGMCLVAGTEVSTPKGAVLIETIKQGDAVYAFDFVLDEKVERCVVDTFIRETTELIEIVTEADTIQTTYEHPFWVEDKGWVFACDLVAGDVLRTADGSKAIVTAVSEVTLDKPVAVYNFEVQGAHAYYVGTSQVLVHNTCAASVPSSSTPKTTAELMRDIKVENGVYSAPKNTVNEIGRAEAAGVDFSRLNKEIRNSRPSTEGGVSQAIRYSDDSGTRFVVHEVTDASSNIIHRDFDAVRIQSGQTINVFKPLS